MIPVRRPGHRPGEVRAGEGVRRDEGSSRDGAARPGSLAATGSLVWSGADGEGSDAPVGRELEMEPQADGAPRAVPGVVGGRVVGGCGGFDVVDGVGNARDLAAPRAGGGDAAVRLALVLDECVV